MVVILANCKIRIPLFQFFSRIYFVQTQLLATLSFISSNFRLVQITFSLKINPLMMKLVLSNMAPFQWFSHIYYIYPSFYLFVYKIINLSTFYIFYLTIHLFDYLTIYLFVYLTINLFVYLTNNLSIYNLTIYISIYLTIYLFI